MKRIFITVLLMLLTIPAFGQLSLQTYGGGQGWSWSLVKNFDVTGDGVSETYFSFFHYSIGRIDGWNGGVKESFQKSASSVTFSGNGWYKGTPAFLVTYTTMFGGIYGNGYTDLYVYEPSTMVLLRRLKLNALYTYMKYTEVD